MWFGGVRVIVLDDEGRMLLVKQNHKEREVWMIPGGGIEEGENAVEAAVREIKEETNLDIDGCIMLRHIEEVSERGQRFVNIFMAKAADTALMRLGSDPEFSGSEQVLSDIRFMSREELASLEAVYPEYIKTTFWQELENGLAQHNVFEVRRNSIK